jgi:hypothetical protein
MGLDGMGAVRGNCDLLDVSTILVRRRGLELPADENPVRAV